jgi:signal peptidase II
MHMTQRMLFRIVLLVVALATVGCDRVTKHIAMTSLAGTPARSYWADTLWIGYTENTGGFLSLGAELPEVARRVLFTWGTGLVLLGIAAVVIRGRLRTAAAIGLTLFVAGGLSNWIDRAMTGRVVDFLNIGIGSLRTGVFNVADMAIMAGAVVVAIGELGVNRARGAGPRVRGGRL